MTGFRVKEIAEQLVGLPVADVERHLILATLRQTDGNRTRAAGILGISVRTMRNKLGAYAREGIDIPQPAQGPGAGHGQRARDGADAGALRPAGRWSA